MAAGAADRLPSGYRTQAEDAGAILIEADASAVADRSALVDAIRERIGAGRPTGSVGGAEEEAVAVDFLALGTARWWLRDLTIAMGHADCLDLESLAREVLAGAHAWQSGDSPAATNRLRAAFELLTQARERFYPVDAYLIDLCLIDPSTPAGALADALAARTPVTFLAPARAIEVLAERDPDASPRSARRSAKGGPTWWAAPMTRSPSRSCRSSRSSGSSATAPRSTASTSTTGRSRPSPGAGSGSIRSCRRWPSGSASGSRCTWRSMPAGSRSVPRPSGSGRPPTARAWRP